MKHLMWISASLLVLGCADSSKDLSIGPGGQGGEFNNAASNGQNGGFVPELEDEFDFAEPAVIGPHVFVANETLNTIAVLDSRSLSIRTVPVGFKPTRVVGPTASTADSRVYVLNQGSSTVSVVTPIALDVKNVDVLRHANSLAASADGTWALAWFDDEELGPGETAGDLSAASLIKADGTALALAVGFRIERVMFASDSASALLLSDDGVSVVRIAELSGDALVPPMAVLPPDLQEFDRTDREVVLDPSGEWAIARVATNAGVVLTELTTGVQWRVPLPGRPTDLDWVGGDTPRVLGMLPTLNHAFVATVPEGLIALADAVVPADMGARDMGAPDIGSPDLGPADMGTSDVGTSDVGGTDAATADASGPDATVVDAGAGTDLPSMPVTGFTFLPLTQAGLGAAEVAPSGATALLFSTIADERRAVLLNLETHDQRGLSFEKGVRGALADGEGLTFVVLHSRTEGDVPVGASPSDPEFIARSWGLSIVDVNSAATRLVLTEQKPGEVTLWRGEGTPRLFMIFERIDTASRNPGPASERDVLRVDLTSFATDTFRVPSLPEGVGRIDDAGRIFVNQKHPQGRITFVEVATDRRQTVTGYQLNSGID